MSATYSFKNKMNNSKILSTPVQEEVINYKLYYDNILDTLSTMSEMNEIKIMFTIIGVMVMMVIVCSAAYRLYSSEKYHESFKVAILHVALTLFA